MRFKMMLVCMSLLTTVVSADQITFSFIAKSNATSVVANGAGLTMEPSLNVLVSDANTGVSLPLAGIDTANTGIAASFTVLSSPDLVVATYDGDGAKSVLIKDTFGNTLLSGTMEDKAALLSGYPNARGSFLGKFIVDFVAPSVLDMFHQVGFQPDGSISLSFGQANLVSTDSITGVVGGGSITIQSNAPTIESSTVLLMIIGMVVLSMKRVTKYI